MAAAITTTPIPWCAAATASFRSTSTCPAARRPRRRSSTEFCSCKRRSAAPARSSGERPRAGIMDAALKEIGDYIVATRPAAATGAAVAYGELTVTAAAAEILSLVEFLRDDPR